MTLNQIAQQAMDYLDSVGVAADYEIRYMHLRIFTDDKTFTGTYDYNISEFMSSIRNAYPQKSPD
jgi:hypothetical protein